MTSATSLFPRSRLLRIRSALSRLGSDVSGNFTMIFAIASPVLLVLITALINYSGAISYRQMLQSAADSAALASTNAMVSGQSVSQAQTIGQNLFQDNVPNFQWARDALNVYPGEFNGTYMTTVTYQTSYPTLVSGLLGGAGTLVTVSATATAAVSGSGSSLDFTYAGTGGIWGDPHMNDADGTSTMFTGCVTTPRSWYAALSDAGIQINFSCDWSTRWNAEAITDISIVIGNHVISTQSTQPTISGNNVENYNGVGWVGAVTIDGVTYNPGLGWTSYLGGMVQSDINDLTPGKEDNYVDITYVNGATTYNITITYDPDQNAALWITATKAGACGVPGGIWGATLAGVDDNNSVVGFQVASATATMPQFNWSTCAPQTAVSQTVHLTQ